MVYGKKEFIQKFAQKAPFTKCDSEIIYDTFCECIREIVLSGDSVHLLKTLKIDVKFKKPRLYHDYRTKKLEMSSPHYNVKVNMMDPIVDEVKKLPVDEAENE